MAESLTVPPAGFDDLPIEAKVDYVQSLWERLARGADEVPVPAWHLAELDARLASRQSDPGGGEPAELALTRVREQLGQRRAR